MFGLPTPARDAEFTTFVNAATPSLSWTAYLLTGDRETAAELLQEAFVRTYVAWRRIRTLINLNIDRWRKRSATPTEHYDRADTHDAEAVADTRDQLVRMLAALPEQQRRVIVLRYFEDLTEADTAEHLGISVGAVKSATSRGLARPRAQYTPTGEEQ
jgi:RNA polymerase sigma-70 factor (sigma-E family)